MRSTSRTDAGLLIDQSADSAIQAARRPRGDERDPEPARQGRTLEDQEHGRRDEERERDPAPRLREVRALDCALAAMTIAAAATARRTVRCVRVTLRSALAPSADVSLICVGAMRHRLGTILLVLGVAVLAWAATVYFWKDPFTTAYTAYEQRQLASQLDEQFATWQPAPRPSVGTGKPNRTQAAHR